MAPRDELERYRALFEFAPDAYIVTDAAGIIIEANTATERLLHVPRQVLTGKPLSTYLGGEPSRFPSLLLEAQRRGSIPESELAVTPRRRKPVDVGVTVTVTQRTPGDAVALCWLLRDISARKHAEEQVRSVNAELERRVQARTEQLEVLMEAQHELLSELDAERGRLEGVLQQMPAGVMIAEAPSGRILLANQEAERLLSSPLPRPISVMEYAQRLEFHREGGPYAASDWPLARTIASGETVTGERSNFRRDDGSFATFEVNSAPIRNSRGDVIAGVVTFFDVTERERRARAEREFVTNAAHELRTPLAAIASAVEVLQAGAKDVPAQRDRFLRHLQDQVHRLQQLVHSLLLLARVQTGHEDLVREEIELEPLLEAVAAEVRPRDGVEMKLECAPGLTAVGNRELLEQALLNIVGNAGKYVERGAIALVACRDDGGVVVEVADTGPGMSVEDRERALERFYRGQDGTAEGFGLGLAIAAQAVESVGGAIEIQSEPSLGTIVRVRLTAGSTA